MSDPVPKLKTLLWRGLRKKCPRCGEGAVFSRWITVKDRCDKCDLQFLENQGDLWGYLVLVDRVLFLFPIVVVIYFQTYNPHSPWFYVFGAGVLAALIFTLPQRNSICLGIDYLLRHKSLAETPPEKK